jgi:hypothetical protein
VVTGKRRLQRTSITNRLSTTIAFQQFVGAPGQHSSDFPPLPLHPGERHRVVSGRLVAHPGNYGGFGSLFKRETLRAGDGSTSYRSCMIGDFGVGPGVDVCSLIAR